MVFHHFRRYLVALFIGHIDQVECTAATSSSSSINFPNLVIFSAGGSFWLFCWGVGANTSRWRPRAIKQPFDSRVEDIRQSRQFIDFRLGGVSLPLGNIYPIDAKNVRNEALGVPGNIARISDSFT